MGNLLKSHYHLAGCTHSASLGGEAALPSPARTHTHTHTHKCSPSLLALIVFARLTDTDPIVIPVPQGPAPFVWQTLQTVSAPSRLHTPLTTTTTTTTTSTPGTPITSAAFPLH